MINLTKITFEQALKIECALLQLESAFTEWIQCWEQLAANNELSEKARETFKSNAEWWADVHKLIYKQERNF